MRILLVILIGLLAPSARAETYRVRGKVMDEAELRPMYEKVATNYVIYRNQVKPAAQMQAFPVTVNVRSFLNDYTAIVEPDEHVGVPGAPDGVKSVGARSGREFTLTDTNDDVRAGIYKGNVFALSLREKSTSLEFSKTWDVMVVDSSTFVNREKKDKTVERLRVLYDVTMRFDDFVTLLQRGQVFPELAGR